MKSLKFTLYLLMFVIAAFSCNQGGEKKSDKASGADTVRRASGKEEKVKLEPVVRGLHAPVSFATAGDDRWFVVEQPGRIVIVKDRKVLPTPFLDITGKVEMGQGYTEKGLLGLAFHPEYRTNGKFYVYYSAPLKEKGLDHKSVLSEFRVSASDPDKAETAERVLLEVNEPQSNHNGGQIAFGPDNYLYIGLGDGGSAGDPHGKTGNGQSLNTLLGKILRIDVNSGTPYAVPKDNPFTAQAGARKEIWAYGLRNPWRFSFDRKTGELYCGDVGQDAYEEVDIIKKGGNYGWRAREGFHEFDNDLPQKGYIDPVFEYPRNMGICIIGGYVYRGKKYSQMDGRYFFADWTGKVYYIEPSAPTKEAVKVPFDKDVLINSFGEDADGELYVLAQEGQGAASASGIIYRVVAKP